MELVCLQMQKAIRLTLGVWKPWTSWFNLNGPIWALPAVLTIACVGQGAFLIKVQI